MRLVTAGILAACAVMLTPPAMAQVSTGMGVKQVPAGKTTPLVAFWNCHTGSVTNDLQVTAERGRADVRPGTTTRCGAPSPMLGVFYTPPSGFRGEDTVHIFRRGIRIEQRVIVR